MEQLLKLLIEYAIPMFNTLMYVRSGHPLNGIQIALDPKQKGAHLMLDYAENSRQQTAIQIDSHPAEKILKLAVENSGNISQLFQRLNPGTQQNNLDFYAWQINQQKNLQKELAIYNRETQLKLADERKETSLKLPEIEKIVQNWPLRLLPSQILNTHTGTAPIPLRIIIAPPDTQTLRASLTTNNQPPNLPEIEIKLAQGLREFLSQNYPLQSQNRPVEFLGDIWQNKNFHSEAGIKALYSHLSSEPTLILESEIDGDFLIFRLAYWGNNQHTYTYQTLFKLPYRSIVYESVKTRAKKWQQTRAKLIDLGKTPQEIEILGGENEINLKILQEEEELNAAGIDTSDLQFPYKITNKDFEPINQLLITSHCIVAGWMADIHHLADRQIAPKLPELLPQLIQQATDQELMEKLTEAAVFSYQSILQTLPDPSKIPEMAVKLATSLTQLPDKTWAKQQINYALLAWLQHKFSSDEIQNLDFSQTPLSLLQADRSLLEQIKDCLIILGEEASLKEIENILKTPEQSVQTEIPKNYETAYTLKAISCQSSQIAISADGKLIAAGSEKNKIGLWEVETGTLKTQLTGHTGPVLTLAISGDGKTLVSSDTTEQRSNIKLWNLETGELIRTLFGHKKSIHALALSPDQQTLASGSHKIKIWNLQTGDPTKTLFGHKEWVYSLAISPTGKLLASASEDKTLKIWHLETETLLRTLRSHNGPVYCTAICPKGEILVSGSADKTLKIWQLQTGKLITTLNGHNGPVYSVAISSDGQRLVSASQDKTIKIWNLNNPENSHTLTGHTDSVYSVAIAAQNIIVSCSADNTIKIWQPTSTQQN
ncbi:WD40 repeat domain-containing protein [Ancylothrix sp. C2]|uniref:WD40 repeat domain-containing protein n=1 Tax=Ancylothrix sp. D3o TaxID=2953691 RepID=UPI0021BA974C|nr:WD40 repeat domain-containing protein [Ancylothrix sp. D3o]MCT7951944.1 WD40 repeat domain-containing protein [Ancylothrix sp. D3o]